MYAFVSVWHAFLSFGMLCASVCHGNHKQSLLNIRIHTVTLAFTPTKCCLNQSLVLLSALIQQDNISCITQKTQDFDSSSILLEQK